MIESKTWRVSQAVRLTIYSNTYMPAPSKVEILKLGDGKQTDDKTIRIDLDDFKKILDIGLAEGYIEI